jgi:hypothetical protein
MLRPLPLFGTGSLPPAASPKPNSRPVSPQIHVSAKRNWTSPLHSCARDFSASESYRLLLALRSAFSWCSCMSSRPRRRWGARKRWWREESLNGLEDLINLS